MLIDISDARVRFFRIEAEALRWREQLAIVGAEFGRTIRHFQQMGKAWLSSADALEHPCDSETPNQERARAGRRAYALKKAAFFHEQARSAALKRSQSGTRVDALKLWDRVDSGIYYSTQLRNADLGQDIATTEVASDDIQSMTSTKRFRTE